MIRDLDDVSNETIRQIAGYSMLKGKQKSGRKHRFSHQIGVKSASAVFESYIQLLQYSAEERVTSLRILLLIMVGSHPRDVGMHIKLPIYRGTASL